MTFKRKAAPVIFEGVTKRYGAVIAVNDVSFQVEAGTLATLLGPSGCGKTTTLRLIAGLELASGGRIQIGARDVTGLSATERDVTMVFQSYALFPHMSVRDNVAYGLTVSGSAKAEARVAAEEGLTLVGLAGYGARMPNELSGGQQQRVAVARALVLEPEVLLFDEPLSNLDAKLRRRMREEIRELQRRLELTAVYVTHDQEEALAVSDQIIVMDQGKIAQTGSPRQLYEAPASRFVADFVGDANMVEAEALSCDGETALIRIGDQELRLRDPGIAPGPVTLALRPEAVQLAAADAGEGIEAMVAKASYLGNHMEYELDCALGRLFALDHRPIEGTRVGQTVRLSLAPRMVAILKD